MRAIAGGRDSSESRARPGVRYSRHSRCTAMTIIPTKALTQKVGVHRYEDRTAVRQHNGRDSHVLRPSAIRL